MEYVKMSGISGQVLQITHAVHLKRSVTFFICLLVLRLWVFDISRNRSGHVGFVIPSVCQNHVTTTTIITMDPIQA